MAVNNNKKEEVIICPRCGKEGYEFRKETRTRPPYRNPQSYWYLYHRIRSGKGKWTYRRCYIGKKRPSEAKRYSAAFGFKR